MSVLESMKGRVKDALMSPHEHHVLRMCIDLVQPQQLQFVVEELKVDVVNFSRHRFGCRIMERLINTCPIQRLARHRVASHVVRYALTDCGEDGQQRLMEALSSDPDELNDLAHHHCGSFVVRQMRRNMSL